MKRTVLIIDGAAANRRLLNEALREDYTVLEARDGREALALIRRESARLSAAVLNASMPEADGFEVLNRMRADAQLRLIPVVAVASRADGEAECKALRLGAADFVRWPCQAEAIRLRIANLIRLRDDAALVGEARTDSLTGLYARGAFFRKAGEMIAAKDAGYYVLACVDIDNFKVLNDQYGSEKGDAALRFTGGVLKRWLDACGGIGCRVTSDDFAVLYPIGRLATGEPDRVRHEAAAQDGAVPPVTVSAGRCVVTDKSLSVSALYDRAIIAMATVKGRFDKHVAQFDESMRDKLLREQVIVNGMNAALAGGQFEVWFQPQYNHSTGKLIGAEALARWRHPQDGLIAPGEFVPVFERNGFIYELDKYVWRETCRLLRRWLDEGRSPLPVSVNISRYDALRDDLIDTVTGLIREYGLPAELLRLEITESAFSDSERRIVDVVKRLIAAGFTIEIDDFGSGYSSLNTLKDVPAQILKLDMRFMGDSENSARSGNVLESVVRMARWLGMAVIAEGVETREQADFLESIGCNYIQGYFYARPMCREAYEALAGGADKEAKLSALETVEALDNSAFWDPKSLDTLIFNSLVGGACIFEYHADHAELLRANRKFARVLGGGEMTLEQALRINLSRQLAPDSLCAARAACRQAVATGEEVACEIELRDLTPHRKRVFLRVTMRVIARAGDRSLFYSTNEDLTEQRAAEEKEHEVYEQMQAVLRNMNGAVLNTVLEDGRPRIAFANAQYYGALGYTKAQYEAEVADAFSVIHPDDREAVKARYAQANRTKEAYTLDYRCIRRDGGVIWCRCSGSVVQFPGARALTQIAVINDVTKAYIAEREKRILAQRMQRIMDNVDSGITAKAAGENGARFIFANDRYYAIFGYTRGQYEAEVTDLYALIHPEDRGRVLACVERADESGAPETIEYRANRRDGRTIWLRAMLSTARFEGYAEPVELCIIADISAEKRGAMRLSETYEQLRFLNETAHDLLTQADADSGIEGVLNRVLHYFDGDRAYVVELDAARGVAKNTYEVCAPGVSREMDNLQAVPLEAAWFWVEAFQKARFISIADVAALGPDRAQEREILARQGITSLVAVPLMRGSVLIGLIGVDDPRRQLHHAGHLCAIGDYLATMLARRDLNAKIERDSKNLREMMDDTPGGFARLRVLPDGTLATVYVNEAFCRLRGMTREAIMAADDRDAMGTIHPDDVELVRRTVADMIATGRTCNTRYRLRRAGGDYIPLTVFGRMSVGGDGERYINVYYAGLE